MRYEYKKAAANLFVVGLASVCVSIGILAGPAFGTLVFGLICMVIGLAAVLWED